MILVDSSVWIDHFRSSEADLVLLITQSQVLQHPYVTAEIMLGNIKNRLQVTAYLNDLMQVPPGPQSALIAFIDAHKLYGTGIGLVDAALLAAAKLTDNCSLWTRDKRLAFQADRLGCLAALK